MHDLPQRFFIQNCGEHSNWGPSPIIDQWHPKVRSMAAMPQNRGTAFPGQIVDTMNVDTEYTQDTERTVRLSFCTYKDGYSGRRTTALDIVGEKSGGVYTSQSLLAVRLPLDFHVPAFSDIALIVYVCSIPLGQNVQFFLIFWFYFIDRFFVVVVHTVQVLMCFTACISLSITFSTPKIFWLCFTENIPNLSSLLQIMKMNEEWKKN